MPAFEPAEGALPAPEPKSGFFRQRWVMEHGAFTLLVKVAPPDTLHVVALDDLGGTLAEATLDGAVRESRAISARQIEAIVADLRALYLPGEGHAVVRIKETGERALHRDGVLRTATEVWTHRSHITIRGEKRFSIEGAYNASVEVE